MFESLNSTWDCNADASFNKICSPAKPAAATPSPTAMSVEPFKKQDNK